MPGQAIRDNDETETGYQIVNCFRDNHFDPDEVPMVLVAGHGPFTWGKSAAKAVYHAQILVKLCRMALFTEQVRSDVPRLKETLIEKHYLRRHGSNAYYGQK